MGFWPFYLLLSPSTIKIPVCKWQKKVAEAIGTWAHSARQLWLKSLGSFYSCLFAFGFETMLRNAQGLLPAQCLRVALGGAQGSLFSPATRNHLFLLLSDPQNFRGGFEGALFFGD